MSMADQDRIVEDGQDTVNGIMRASRLKRWRARQFFILTNGAGDEQERQVNKIREQARALSSCRCQLVGCEHQVREQ